MYTHFLRLLLLRVGYELMMHMQPDAGPSFTRRTIADLHGYSITFADKTTKIV